MSNNSIPDKILLLLDKTKEALIEDLKKEFISVRTALDEDSKTDEAFKLKSEFSKKVNIIDAVFAKVGYDISHYEQLGNLKTQVLSLLDCVDNLTADVQQLSDNYKKDEKLDADEVADFLKNAVPHVQTLLSVVKSVADIEWDRVAEEMGNVGNDIKNNIKEQFLTKEFARKVLDHILITLLKCGKDVFHDEIEYVRMTVVNGIQQTMNTAEELANGIVRQITDGVNDAQNIITNQVNALLRETLDEYTGIKNRLGDEAEKVKNYITEAGEEAMSSNIYVKLTRALSITYSILDFLGVIREVKVTLRLPAKLQDLIGQAQGLVTKADGELSKAIGNLSTKIEQYTGEATSGIESLQGDVVDALQDASTTVANATAHIAEQMDQDLQVTKEVTGLSVAALGTMQTQLLTLYGSDGKSGEIGKAVDGINGMLNNLSTQLTGTCAVVNSAISNECKTINNKLETVKNISYPVTIVTISWSSVEKLFTKPVEHFKSLYPINNVDDIESLMRRIMGIMHCINPDIPDFDSLRNMLESLLKRLQQKVIMLVNEAKKKAEETAKQIWEKFQPIIATIRKVIDMLKELALALKEKMYGVLNDLKAEMGEVMDGAKQLIGYVQDQIKSQTGEILNGAGNLVGQLNTVFDNIDSVNQTIVAAAAQQLGDSPATPKPGVTRNSGAGEAGGLAATLAEEVSQWVEDQRKSLEKINVPRIVKRTLVDPLLNCASGIIYDVCNDVGNGLNKMPDFVSAYNLLQDIASLPTLLNRQFVLQPVDASGVQLPTMEFRFSDMAGNATSAIQTALTDINNVVKSVNLNVFDIDVESIVVPQLQAWAYGVTSSIKTVVDPKVWKTRLDTLIAQLQAEFQNDLQNITGLISKEGANRLIADAGAVKEQLKNNLQINDYVTIVQTALDDVVLPNPELYFNSLKTTLANIVAQLAAKLIETFNTLKSQLSSQIDQIKKIATDLLTALKGVEEQAVRNALAQLAKAKNWAEDMRDKVAKEAWKRFQVVRDAVMDIAERIQELVENVREFIALAIQITPDKIAGRLENILKNRLEDLALEIWNNLKAEVINPILNTIKDEIIRRIRALVKKALQQLIEAMTQVEEATGELAQVLNKVPGIKELKSAISTLAGRVENVIRNNNAVKNALQGIEGFDPNAPKITDLNQLPAILEKVKGLDDSLLKSFTLELQLSDTCVNIPPEYICWAQSLIQATINFAQSDMKANDIINLVVAIYKGIPESVKDYVATLMPELPELPDNGLTRTLKQVTCSYDLDNKFCNVTLLNLTGNAETRGTTTNASLLVQVFAFVGTYNPEEENEDVKVTVKDGNDSKGGDGQEKEEDKGKPALYFMFYLRGELKFAVFTENHEFRLNLEAAAGEQFNGGGEGNKPSNQSLGFCLTKKTDDDPRRFHLWASTDSLSGLLDMKFQRKEEAGPLRLITTEYLDINIGNYPLEAYALFNSEYPDDVKSVVNYKEKVRGFTAGVMASLNDVEIILKLRQNAFFQSFLKDDISAKFSLQLLYDYLKGFDIDGGYSFHLDLDCGHMNFGVLDMQGLGIDIGSLKNDWGTLQVGVGSTFNINLDVVSFSFENLGVSLSLNVLKPDFSLGDWDFGCKFKFPTGVGISIDAPAVKGSGLVDYNEDTGELFGELELKIVGKFGVTAVMLVDLGTAKDHFFSFVGLISTTFTPGIPLGMGFSLTGIGGCLGLERMIDRTAVTTAVRQGTLASVFFVEDVKKHMAEMKTTAMALFPAKKGNFFVGLLGQISFEPVLTCSFGLMVQAPSAPEAMIVGSLKVAISGTDVIRINVQFAGGISFEEGLWFDASIIDSEIVGIKLEGDMAFRLNWGGPAKGFLLSIGGFHPNYTPDPGMQVADMKRLAMKMDYKILKIGLETYLAITSNSFQIGAHLDLKIGWDKFGITGYAGFDALFQFDPFMFMFDVECGVAVKCGSWKLLSIDLAFSLSGPRPWHVSGKAKFYFLFIPIKVSFSLEWGNKQPELPNKKINLEELFREQIDNNDNWAISETAQTDDAVVVSMKPNKDEHNKADLLVQPFQTIYFNQSAIPLQLVQQGERVMDLCNNAVPSDYKDLVVTGFKLPGTEIEKESGEYNLTNDFAPGLYYNLSNQEKLSTPSYKEYVSGFSLSVTQEVTKGAAQGKDPVINYCIKTKGQQEPAAITVTNVLEGTIEHSEAPARAAAPEASPKASPKVLRRGVVKEGRQSEPQIVTDPEKKDSIGLVVGALQYNGGVKLGTIVKGVKESKMRKPLFALKTKTAFDRYIKTLDSINENY